ncbi:uncharacterized protein HMPREF1541_07158 [Cyphellophora europaea CBS 101466]|uniref:Poly(A) polymerase n=1 Tax=Cyphellophora europaea (strain CBS 101466) TaxID=1220924 RepID=W2RLZ9_CYPE1|nr:uncharacterized protein HMPREF1541_07158 [Cyphellophora europaea CBS 101466]ETN37536.1 hypothetical protein HMPREF1541_07158 [Cyphellophora europaea CBS 101466]
MASASKQYGVSPPISTALPEQNDVEKNAELVEELKRENNYETQDETKKRMATLGTLQRCVIEFVKEVSRSQRLPESQIAQFGGKVYPYGSYRLGVYGPGSDIDTLAVAPRHIKRADFFEHFPNILRRMVPESSIGYLIPVVDAFVPIIKMLLNDIEIDLIFASIETLSTIPKDLSLNDNKLLDGMDQASIRAITGPRVTDEILAQIPEAKTFRTALRAIKLWAQRRAVYANIVGYPGGVAWAMLVARVCQLYPHAVGATIVHKFFFVMKDWKWPIPVMLKEIEQGNGKEKVWNPQIYPGDRKNIMPIITPAYPSMCSTYNISKSGKAVILRELERGSKITQEIFFGKGKWSDLFQKHTFFTKDHKYYLSVIVSAKDPDQVKAWGGMVESKVRVLVMQLELQNDQISLARPFVKGFSRAHHCDDDAQRMEVRKGSMKYKVEQTKIVENGNPGLVVDGDATGASGGDSPTPGGNFNTYTFYIGIDLTPQAQKNLNISAAISYFKNVCQGWQSYDPNLHFIDAVPVKAHELPDDLFDKKLGETKPVKPVKKIFKQQKPLARGTEEAENLVNGDSKRQKTGTETPTPAPTQSQTPTPAAA